MHFDLAMMGPKQSYNLLTALVVPRPIAWVTSRNRSGRLNVAPFSFFNIMSGNPPVLAIGIGARDGKPKDTARNIIESREFVVNLVNEDCARPMNATAIDFPEEVDEASEVGLGTCRSVHVGVPRLEMSPVALECTVMQVIPIEGARSIVIGAVAGVHVRDDAVLNAERGHVDAFALGLIGRLHGSGWYARIGDAFQMPRLSPEEWQVRGLSEEVD